MCTTAVQVQSPSGETVIARALLDTGFQSNFISAELCDKLKLTTYDANAMVTGITNASRQIKRKCNVKIKSCAQNFSIDLSCLVIPVVSSSLPNFIINLSNLHLPSDIHLADPNFYKPGKVDLLLGNGCFWTFLEDGRISLSSGINLQNTVFDWVVSGTIPRTFQSNTTTICNFSEETSLINFNLKSFWELEETPTTKVLSIEEKVCETHFVLTYERDEEGRFVVKIPFKTSPSLLGDSFNRAERQFLNLEQKLSRNEKIYQ